MREQPKLSDFKDRLSGKQINNISDLDDEATAHVTYQVLSSHHLPASVLYFEILRYPSISV